MTCGWNLLCSRCCNVLNKAPLCLLHLRCSTPHSMYSSRYWKIVTCSVMKCYFKIIMLKSIIITAIKLLLQVEKWTGDLGSLSHSENREKLLALKQNKGASDTCEYLCWNNSWVTWVLLGSPSGLFLSSRPSVKSEFTEFLWNYWGFMHAHTPPPTE